MLMRYLSPIQMHVADNKLLRNVFSRLSAGTGSLDGISRPDGIWDWNFKIGPVPISGRV